MVRFSPKRMRLGACCLALLAFAGSALAGGDTSLDVARRDVDASDYLGARAALVSALNAGNASPDDLAEIYKLSGIVEAALGDDAAATGAFAKWLALDPKAALPFGTSPKITRPFDAAAEQAKQRGPITVKTETSADPPSVTLVVESDPVDIIRRARVFVRADGKREVALEGAGTGRITISLPHGGRLDLRVQALDEHGNRVVVLGTKDVPIVITGAGGEVVPPGGHPGDKTQPDHVAKKPPKPIEPPHARPLWARWWLWGSVSVAFGAAGTYFGIQARKDADDLRALNAASQDHRFTEAQDLESRGRRDVLLFNIGMGAAGAFAIGAAILYLTEPKAATETRLTAVPVRGGGAVVLGGAF